MADLTWWQWVIAVVTFIFGAVASWGFILFMTGRGSRPDVQ